jgi:hypothetical protein
MLLVLLMVAPPAGDHVRIQEEGQQVLASAGASAIVSMECE